MAQIPYRVDLTTQRFPLLSSELGRSVLVSSFKNTPTGEESNDPQIIYMHNVMPTSRGVVSVGYEEVIPATTGADTNFTFNDVRIIFGDEGGRVHFGITTDGDLYAIEPGDIVWRKLTPPASSIGVFITDGTVNGITYIYFQGIGAYKYDESAHDLVSVSFTGLSLSGVIGITASSGYLVAYNDTDVAWSSTVDPLDFTPSAVTGAGGGSVSDTAGYIIFIVPNSLGLMVYTSANCVSAQYTGNLQYPFRFKSVDNSKGALGLDFVAYEANSSEHYAYTKGGLQSLDSRAADIILPEVTDFLAGKQLEDYDEITNILSTTDLTTTMKKKVKLIASRYLIISYGINTFTHALVYDIGLKRLGKLKINHVDCFEYLGTQSEISKETVAFVINTGQIKVLKFSVTAVERPGVLILGNYQYSRDRQLVLHNVVAENVKSTDSFICRTKALLEDGSYNEIAGQSSIKGTARSNLFFISGINHSITFIGSFNLSTVQLLFTVGGIVRYG